MFESLRCISGARGGRLAVVGAGPAGLAASAAAKKMGLRTLTLEQESIGGTVYHYPRDKMVITRPVEIPGYGRIDAREIRKEELLALWNDVIRTVGIEVRVGERVTAIEPRDGGFVIETTRGRYCAARAILAVGRRGSPRKLGVPGEDLPHVMYTLGDASQVTQRRVLVVGGGNSALEAAKELADPRLENAVTLSYRGAAFGRATPANREYIEQLKHSGRLEVITCSQVEGIGTREATVLVNGEVTSVPAEIVFVMIGGELPAEFLERLGVEVDVKFGTA